jgi:hypothetical protein
MGTSTPATRYMAMELPDRKEWHPISSILNPSNFSPIDATAALIFVLIWLELMWAMFPCLV